METDPEPWEGHPEAPVSPEELARLIAEDWERTLGR